jgi:hypothetical protein
MAVYNHDHTDAMLKAVSPPETAGTGGVYGGEYGHFRFPLETIAKRRCQLLGPDQPVGRDALGHESPTGSGVWIPDAWEERSLESCSGNGECNDDGDCECDFGYGGRACEIVIVAVPQTTTARAQLLTDVLDCRTEMASAHSTCSSTLYLCGHTCTDSLPQTAVAHLSFNREVATRDHFSITGHAASNGVDQESPAGLSCSDNSVVDVSFAQFSGNSQSGTGGAAIFVDSSALNISFSKLNGNTNDGSGAAGIVAQQQSVVGVFHTDFFQNELQSDFANSGAALTCDASVTTIVHSRFAENRGVPIMLSGCAVLSMQHSAVVDNNACDSSGSECSASAGVVIRGASTATIRDSMFVGNIGPSAGAVFVAGTGSELTTSDCTFINNRGVHLERASGALMSTESARVVVSGGTFDNNLGSAPVAAGAMMAMDAQLQISESVLQLNQIQGNPHATAGAGGIYSERSSVSVANSDVSGNNAIDETDSHASLISFGKELHAVSPTRAYVVDSTFKNFDDTSSVLILPGVSRGILRGSCQEYPCAPGFGCVRRNASLSCTPCSTTTYSADGISCQMCGQGYGPNPTQTGCQQCTGNSHSEFGVCEPCATGLVVDEDRVRCSECGLHRTAVSTASQTRSICSCAQGYYNQSSAVHVCFRDGYSTSHEQQVLGRRENVQASTGQSCAACAKDTEDEECVTCTIGSSPVLRAGYTAIQESSSRRQLQTHDRDLAVSFIFRCHHDLEISALRCPGGDIEASCAEGYEGYTCGSCVEGYGMSADKECLLCDSNEITFGGVLLLVGALLGFAVILAVIGKYWMRFPWRHVVRCAAQPTRILITYTQVTSQLGDVLNYSFPGAFGDIVRVFKPILDIWGVLFSIVGPSECFGMKGYTSRWLLRVVALPLIGFTFVALAYAYDHRSSAAAARTNLSTRMFFVL